MKTIDEYLSEKIQAGEDVTIVGLDVQSAGRVEDVTRHDAARYGWLRDEGGNTFSWDEWRNLADLSPSEFDAAIDARMPKTPNAIGQRGAACGASAAPTGCASDEPTE